MTKDLDLPESKAIRARAIKMGVSVIGMETFLDDERLFRAMKAISEGKTVLGRTTID